MDTLEWKKESFSFNVTVKNGQMAVMAIIELLG